jgi:hypothetical protein
MVGTEINGLSDSIFVLHKGVLSDILFLEIRACPDTLGPLINAIRLAPVILGVAGHRISPLGIGKMRTLDDNCENITTASSAGSLDAALIRPVGNGFFCKKPHFAAERSNHRLDCTRLRWPVD